MPSLPTSGDVHVNRPLTNIAIAYMQQESAFIAGKVFPAVPVAKQSDSYFIWDKGDFARDDARERGPGSLAPVGAVKLSTDSYNAKVFAYAKLISDQERANQDDPLNLDKTAAEVVAQKLLIRREKQWVSKCFVTGVWGTDLVGGVDFTVWSNYVASDPVNDIRQRIFQLCKTPGIMPKDLKLVLGPEVFQKLLDHPKFLERYEQTQAAILNEQLIAAVLGIGEVLVPMATNNTAAEGAADSFGYIHGKNALLVHAAPSPAINVPSGGYHFTWTGLVGADGMGMRVKRYRREEYAADQVEGETAFDPKVVSPALGVFFSGAVA
jgi:hypothetical protein